MTTEARQDSWLKSRNLARLGFSVALSTPVAGALLALILGFTVLRSVIFTVPHPTIDSHFVDATFGQIIINSVMVAVGGFVMGGIVGWPLMLALGLPMHAVLIRKTTAKAWQYALAGFIAGALGGLLRFTAERGQATANDLTLLLSIGGVAGVLAALLFWFARRPDKDAAEYKS